MNRQWYVSSYFYDFMIKHKVHSLLIWTYFTFESTSSFKSDFAATRNIGTFPLCSFSSGSQRSRTFIKENWWSYEHNSRIISVNEKLSFFIFFLNLGPNGPRIKRTMGPWWKYFQLLTDIFVCEGSYSIIIFLTSGIPQR